MQDAVAARDGDLLADGRQGTVRWPDRVKSAVGARRFVLTFSDFRSHFPPGEETKTPVTFWATGAYREMERAKRLELSILVERLIKL